MNLVHDKGLGHLGLGQRRRDFQNGFIGKHRGAFRHCPDTAGEAEVTQPLKKRLGKLSQGPEIIQAVQSESQIFQIVQNRVQAAGRR